MYFVGNWVGAARERLLSCIFKWLMSKFHTLTPFTCVSGLDTKATSKPFPKKDWKTRMALFQLSPADVNRMVTSALVGIVGWQTLSADQLVDEFERVQKMSSSVFGFSD